MVPKVKALAPAVPVDIIPMGTDLSTLFVPPKHRQQRSKAEIVFVGRLVEKKGLRYLLEAFAVLRPNNPALKLTIVGDGPLRGDLVTQAQRLGIDGDLSFLGGVRHRDLPAIYQRATVAVFPFVISSDGDQEGFGLVVIEAMGCGCPVIASDVPAVRENIVSGVTGLLVRQKDSRALADAMETCLINDRLRSTLAESAMERARMNFDWSRVAQEYRRAINACIQTVAME